MRRPLPALVTSLGLLAVSCTSDGADTEPTVDVAPATTAEPGEPSTSDETSSGDEPASDDPAMPGDDASSLLGPDVGHAEATARFVSVLPDGTETVVALDLGTLLAGDSSTQVTSMLRGDGGDPFIAQFVDRVVALVGDADVAASISTAVVAEGAGSLLLARLRDGGAAAEAAGLDVLPGGVLVAGSDAAVQVAIDAVNGAAPSERAISPFLDALDTTSPLSFVALMPARFDEVALDRSLRGASAVSGAIDIAGGAFSGALAFHTHDAEGFVETYNRLDRNAIQGDPQTSRPLTLVDPVVDDLGQVVVDIPSMPLGPTREEARLSRNLFKKLFVGMEAQDYAEEVAERDEGAWLDFLVRSEADPEPTAGSVYIRWSFKDQSAIDAFEANELPAGFRLAPTQFLESDDPAGEYFFALNIYNAGGGSIVNGARAEWDVFVHPPEGADPNAGVRPRFGVVDVLAEDVSADAGNLLTLAEPVSHQLVDGRVVSDIGRFGPDDSVTPAFESNFPVPDPTTAEVARFTREMAIGNDYIYWAHGVSDRVLYNATTFNHDAYFVDIADTTFLDSTPWAAYLQPEIMDAVYYVNTLEYVASPMTNLDADYLDITPEWRAALQAFTTNGHQEGLMRKFVEQLFLGQADALVGFDITNEEPATFFHFEIDDPDAMADAIGLPDGHQLRPTALYTDGPEAHHLTLSVFEIDGSVEGTRAQWSVIVDDGSGRPKQTVIERHTERVGFDPVTIINLPDTVDHALADGTVATTVASPTIRFEASFPTADVTEHELSLDWIESGDDVCALSGICDRFYYDAETLDVPVHQPGEVTVTEFESPWSEFVGEQPSVVFYRDNFQEYVVSRWFDLDVPVEPLPFTGLDDPTHTISGEGELVGRTSEVGDSTYDYAGDAIVDGDEFTFALDQTIVNALGEGHIFTTGTFDLATGQGTQTVVDCQGPSLLCSDIEVGSSAFYTAQNLDVADDSISWAVDVAVDLGGAFGIADSASTFLAEPVG